MTSMFYGLDVMDCNVKPSLAEGLQMPQGAPQGENTKGTFVKGHLCAYLYYKSWPVIFPTAIFHTENCRTKNL